VVANLRGGHYARARVMSGPSHAASRSTVTNGDLSRVPGISLPGAALREGPPSNNNRFRSNITLCDSCAARRVASILGRWGRDEIKVCIRAGRFGRGTLTVAAGAKGQRCLIASRDLWRIFNERDSSRQSI